MGPVHKQWCDKVRFAVMGRMDGRESRCRGEMGREAVCVL